MSRTPVSRKTVRILAAALVALGLLGGTAAAVADSTGRDLAGPPCCLKG